MYIVTIENGAVVDTIHGVTEKLKSGKVVKAINAIDSCTFTMLPSNVGFNRIHDFMTLVRVYNDRKRRYEFQGRVLCSSPGMTENGLITKDVTCESFFGFLCDSEQPYVTERNWTRRGLLQHIITQHNAQVEEYKRFTLGEVDNPDDNVYVGIQRKKSWDTIKEKLLDKEGGEICFRVVDGGLVIDYLEQIGETKSTPIALSHNMKAIIKESDPFAYVTRLIPLGCKLKDASGNETEERLTIAAVNDGKEYIDDTEAIAAYGLHVGSVEWDDVTEAANLLRKGREWLVANNKVQVKYAITALDLSLLGLDIDDFDVHNSHPVKNALLGIDDTARIIKKNLDICEEVKSTIEVGDNFKTLSEIQREQAAKVENAANTIAKIEADYVTNQAMKAEVEATKESIIKQTEDEVLVKVSEDYVERTEYDQYKAETATELKVQDDSLQIALSRSETNKATLEKYFTFDENGITIRSGVSGDFSLTLDHGMIVFKRNGVTFGKWDGVNFYTGNIMIEVTEKAQFGAFAFEPEYGGLALNEVGE